MTGRRPGALFASLLRVAGFGSVGTVMAERNFRLYMIGHAINLPGLWSYRVALAWLTWDLTHSGTWLGLIAAADVLPAIVLGPFGGALADRFDRAKMTMITQVILLIFAVAIAALTLLDAIGIIGLFVLTFLRGVNLSFWQPVRLTLIPSLVPRQHLGTAIALNATVFNTAFFIGPAIAGPLILLGGPGLAFAFDAASSFVFLVTLLAIRFPPSKPSAGRASVIADIAEGFAFIFRHPGIRAVLLLAAASGLGLRPVGELLAGFTDLLFSGGAGTLSAFTSALGLGALIGAIWIIRGGERDGKARQVLRAGLVAAAAVAAFLATGFFPLALVALTVAGFGFTVIGILGQTLLQHAVPDAIRGRVLSIFGLIMRGAPGLGALVMGLASSVIGLRAPLFFGVVAVIAIFAFAWTRRRQLAQALAEAPVPALAPEAEQPSDNDGNTLPLRH